MTNIIVHGVKGLACVILTLGNTFIMTPLWLYSSIFRKKTSKQCPNALQNYLTLAARAFLYWMTVCGTKPALNTRTPSKLRDWLLCRKFTWIEPASTDAKGEKESEGDNFAFESSPLPVRLDGNESKKKTAGLWFFNPREKAPSMPMESPRQSSVILYFHGGAYITLEAGDIFMGLTLARMQAKYAGVDVLSINYRLAPQAKYPTQLFEAFSAWVHLRKLGYTKIFLGGDSAGANLALTLWQYLSKVNGASDTICGLVLHSPWLDFVSFNNEEFAARSKECALTSIYPRTGLKEIQTNGKPEAQDPWLSPLSWSNDTVRALPPLFVSNGGAETLLNEANLFVKRAKDEGIKVEHNVFDGHPHDFVAIPWFVPSIKRLQSSLGEWVKTVQSSGEA